MTFIPEHPREDEALRDGIAEEDNAIPLWFNVGFYGLIAVGIVYILYYVGSGWNQADQYAAQAAVAEEKVAAARAALPSTNPYRGDATAVGEGSEVFAQICAACHLPDGRGLVGPSLIDPYWKYGNADPDLFATVSDGRPLGMPPWGPQLGAEKIWKVLAYMETLPMTDEPGVGSPEHDAAQAAESAGGAGG